MNEDLEISENLEDLITTEEETPVSHVNIKTYSLFEEMLNEVGKPIKIGDKQLGYGESIRKINFELFISLFNQWVSLCLEKGIMKKTLSSNAEKQTEWSQEMGEVQRALKGLETLREIL
tara:strand:- start:290 stop:646 length:357 start_codon:yes stop_codon:yes gene_type:complete